MQSPAALREEIESEMALAERERAYAESLRAEVSSLALYRCASGAEFAAERATLEHRASLADRRRAAHVLRAAELHEELTLSLGGYAVVSDSPRRGGPRTALVG